MYSRNCQNKVFLVSTNFIRIIISEKAFKGYEKRVMEILIIEKLLKSLYCNSGIWSRVSGDTFRNL